MDDWTYKPRYTTFNLIGEEGSGDNPDFDKLQAARTYVAAFRGHVIHEVTQLEDKITESIRAFCDDEEVSTFLAETFLKSIKDSFEKKKQLFRKLNDKFGFIDITPEMYSNLDWLQSLRNDFAHGTEYMHTSWEYVEIENKETKHRLPSEELKNRFDEIINQWNSAL